MLLVGLSVVALGLTIADAVRHDPAPVRRPPADAPTAAARQEIPASILATYRRAAREECPGLPWAVLAGIGAVETGHGTNKDTSSAGAQGPMQFLPSSWAAFGVDGDGDGQATLTDPVDSIYGAARYLCASDGDRLRHLRQAIWNYNHADWYVDRVLTAARRYARLPAIPPRQAA